MGCKYRALALHCANLANLQTVDRNSSQKGLRRGQTLSSSESCKWWTTKLVNPELFLVRCVDDVECCCSPDFLYMMCVHFRCARATPISLGAAHKQKALASVFFFFLLAAHFINAIFCCECGALSRAWKGKLRIGGLSFTASDFGNAFSDSSKAYCVRWGFLL